MSSAQNPHGGQEATILSLYTTMYHWGAVVAAPGYTDAVTFAAGGNPYGTSVTVGQDGKIADDEAAIKAAVAHQAKRTVKVGDSIEKYERITVRESRPVMGRFFVFRNGLIYIWKMTEHISCKLIINLCK